MTPTPTTVSASAVTGPRRWLALPAGPATGVLQAVPKLDQNLEEP
jgi:hypothetical protein